MDDGRVETVERNLIFDFCLQVYIDVINENDNVPLSEKAVYYASVLEDSPEGTPVAQISATDRDADPKQRITYTIIGGNPEGFFTINTNNGK